MYGAVLAALGVVHQETVQNFVPWRGNPLMRRPTYEHRQRPTGPSVMPRGVVHERRPSERLGLDQAATAGSLRLGLSMMRARDSSPM